MEGETSKENAPAVVSCSKNTTKELVIVSGNDKGFVDVQAYHVLADVRRLLKEKFDDDMLPCGEFFFCANGVRLSSKQEARKLAWGYIKDMMVVSIHTRKRAREEEESSAEEAHKKVCVAPEDIKLVACNDHNEKQDLMDDNQTFDDAKEHEDQEAASYDGTTANKSDFGENSPVPAKRLSYSPLALGAGSVDEATIQLADQFSEEAPFQSFEDHDNNVETDASFFSNE